MTQITFSSPGNFLGTTCEAARLNSAKSTHGGKIFHYQGNIAEFTQGKVFSCKKAGEEILKKEIPKIISTMQEIFKTCCNPDEHNFMKAKKLKTSSPASDRESSAILGCNLEQKMLLKTHASERGGGCRLLDTASYFIVVHFGKGGAGPLAIEFQEKFWFGFGQLRCACPLSSLCSPQCFNKTKQYSKLAGNQMEKEKKKELSVGNKH